MALGISGCPPKLIGHLAPCPFRVVWGQAASFLSLSFPLCNTRGLTYPTDFSKPPSGYQERVWTDAKESQNRSKAVWGRQTRARQGPSHGARLFEEPRVAGTEPAGRKQTERHSPPPTPSIPLSGIQLCPAKGGAGSRGAAPWPGR